MHYSDVIMSTMASQITCISIVCSTVGSGGDQRKHHSSMSLAFLRGDQWPVNSQHKKPVTRNMVPFDDIIMNDSDNDTDSNSLDLLLCRYPCCLNGKRNSPNGRIITQRMNKHENTDIMVRNEILRDRGYIGTVIWFSSSNLQSSDSMLLF